MKDAKDPQSHGSGIADPPLAPLRALGMEIYYYVLHSTYQGTTAIPSGILRLTRESSAPWMAHFYCSTLAIWHCTCRDVCVGRPILHCMYLEDLITQKCDLPACSPHLFSRDNSSSLLALPL